MPELEELNSAELLALAFVDDEEGEAGEEEEGSPPNPVIPEVNEIIWAAVFFFALWAALKYVLLPPIQKTRQERAAKIAAAKDASDTASGDLATVQAEYDDKLATARAEAAGIIDAVRAEADAERANLVAAAEAEVAEMRATAMTEIAAARRVALTTLRPQAAQVAASAASTVVGRVVDPAAATPVIERLLVSSGGDA